MMASKHVTGAQYGVTGSKEELAKSGYRLPDSFFVEAKPDGSGEPSAEEKAQLKSMKGPTENKAVVPATEDKTAALKKPARAKSARSRK